MALGNYLLGDGASVPALNGVLRLTDAQKGTFGLASGVSLDASGNLTLPGTLTVNKLNVTNGAATSGAMVAGAVTVSSSLITTTSTILYSRKTLGGTAGQVSITAQANGSFTLTSSSNTETSTFNWCIV